MATIYRTYDWWAYLLRIRQRRQMPGIEEYDRQLVDFIWETLGLSAGDQVLDAGCAGGTQAIELARKGAAVTGVDFAPSLIAAARELSRKADVEAHFRVGDLMKLDEHARFDAVVLLSTTFGLLSDGSRFLRLVQKALKPGGRLLIEEVNPARYSVDVPPTTVQVDKLELTFSTRFKPERMILESHFHVKDEYGRTIRFRRNEKEPDESVKLHTAEDFARLVEGAGLKVERFWGDVALPPAALEENSPKIITIARKSPNL